MWVAPDVRHRNSQVYDNIVRRHTDSRGYNTTVVTTCGSLIDSSGDKTVMPLEENGIKKKFRYRTRRRRSCRREFIVGPRRWWCFTFRPTVISPLAARKKINRLPTHTHTHTHIHGCPTPWDDVPQWTLSLIYI